MKFSHQKKRNSTTLCVGVCMCVSLKWQYCFAIPTMVSAGFNLPMFLCLIPFVLVCLHRSARCLAVPSWHGWSHDLTKGRPSTPPGSCLQEREGEREREKSQAKLKMREGCWGLGEKNQGGICVCVCGGVLER